MFPFSFRNSLPSRQEAIGPSSFGALFQRFIPALSRRGSVGGMLEHLGSMPLTAQSSLALVRLNGETLLLGITPQSISLLTKGNDPTVAAPVAAQPPRESRRTVAP